MYTCTKDKHIYIYIHICVCPVDARSSVSSPCSRGGPQIQDSSKGGAVETGCSDLYAVVY